jgi:hypothetical protein
MASKHDDNISVVSNDIAISFVGPLFFPQPIVSSSSEAATGHCGNVVNVDEGDDVVAGFALRRNFIIARPPTGRDNGVVVDDDDGMSGGESKVNVNAEDDDDDNDADDNDGDDSETVVGSNVNGAEGRVVGVNDVIEDSTIGNAPANAPKFQVLDDDDDAASFVGEELS